MADLAAKQKFKELQKYIPVLDAWLERLAVKINKEESLKYQTKIHQLRKHLVKDDTKLNIDGLKKCEQVLIGLQRNLEKCEKAIEKPGESLEQSRAKLKSIVIKDNCNTDVPGPSKVPDSDYSNCKQKPLYARRPNADETRIPIETAPHKREFTRVLKSPDSVQNTQLFERRPQFCSSISPSQQDRYSKHKKIKINIESYDYLERVLNHKDDDADKDKLRLDLARIVSQLRDYVPEIEIPRILAKKIKRKRKKNFKSEEVEEGEIRDSDSDMELLYDDLDSLPNRHSSVKIKLVTSLPKLEKPDTESLMSKNNEYLQQVKEESLLQPPLKAFTIDTFSTLLPNKSHHSNENDTFPETPLERGEKNTNIEEKSQIHKSDSPIIKSRQTEKETLVAPTNSASLETSNKDATKEEKKGETETNEKSKNHYERNEELEMYKDVHGKTNEQKHKHNGQDHSGRNKHSEKDKRSEDDKTLEKAGKIKHDKQMHKEKHSDSDKHSHRNKHTDKEKILENSIPSEGSKCRISPVNEKYTNAKKKITQTEEAKVRVAEKSSLKDTIFTETSKSKPTLDSRHSISNDPVSEIEILTALKNEILECYDSKKPPVSEIPSMHQPNIITKIKDSSVLESERKKRISIDMYKSKPDRTQNESKSTLFETEKQRLRKNLTKKEFERFFPVIDDTISDNICDPETQTNISLNKSPISPMHYIENSPPFYPNACPKSPEASENSADIPTAPKIIPNDPVENSTENNRIEFNNYSHNIVSSNYSIRNARNLENPAAFAERTTRCEGFPGLYDNSSSKPLLLNKNTTNIALSQPVQNRYTNVSSFQTTPIHNPFEDADNSKHYGSSWSPWQQQPQSFSAYEPNRTPIIRKTVYAPGLGDSSNRAPGDSLGRSQWDRRDRTRSPSYFPDRSHESISNRFSEVFGRNINSNSNKDVAEKRQDPRFYDDKRGRTQFDRYSDSRYVDSGNRTQSARPRGLDLPTNDKHSRYHYEAQSSERNSNNLSSNRFHNERFNNNDSLIGESVQHSRFINCDPRRGRQFYNPNEKIRNFAPSSKPNPGFTKEDYSRSSVDISYIKSWKPKGYGDDSRNRFERAQSVGREIKSTIAVRENTVHKRNEPNRENLVSIRPNFSRSKSVGPKCIPLAVDPSKFRSFSREYDTRKSDRVEKYSKVRSSTQDSLHRTQSKFRDNLDIIKTRETSSRTSRDLSRGDKHGKTCSYGANASRNYSSVSQSFRQESNRESNRESKYNKYKIDHRYKRDDRHRDKYRYEDDRRSSASPRKQQGINYTSENIARGRVVSSFGVKNYKIPKLKKAEEPLVDAQTIEEKQKIIDKPTVEDNLTKQITTDMTNDKQKEDHKPDINIKNTAEKSLVEDETENKKEKSREALDLFYSNKEVLPLSEKNKIRSDVEATIKKKMDTKRNILNVELLNEDSADSFTDDNLKLQIKNIAESLIEESPRKSQLEKTCQEEQNVQTNHPNVDQFSRLNQTKKDAMALVFEKTVTNATHNVDSSPCNRSLMTEEPVTEKETEICQEEPSSAFESNICERNIEVCNDQNVQNLQDKGTSDEMLNNDHKKTQDLSEVNVSSHDEKEITSSSKCEESTEITSTGAPQIVTNQLIDLKEPGEFNHTPDSTENSQEQPSNEQKECTVSCDIPDSTSAQQNIEKKTEPESDDSDAAVKVLMSLLADPTKLKEVLPKMPLAMQKSLIALTNFNEDSKKQDATEVDSTDDKNSTNTTKNIPQASRKEGEETFITETNEKLLNSVETDSETKTDDLIPDKRVSENHDSCVAILNKNQLDSSDTPKSDSNVLPEYLQESNIVYKNDISKKKNKSRLGELESLQDDLKDYLTKSGTSSFFSGMRACRLNNKTDYRENSDKTDKISVTSVTVENLNKSNEKCNDSASMYESDLGRLNKTRKKTGPKPKLKVRKNSEVDSKENEADFPESRNKGLVAGGRKKLKTKLKVVISKKDILPVQAIQSSHEAEDLYNFRENTESNSDIIRSGPVLKAMHFRENVTKYNCYYCDLSDENIVYHYKTVHHDKEVVISRLDGKTAVKARQQSTARDFEALKRSNDKFSEHICRFCSKQFLDQQTLEGIFWHIVSEHTGEYVSKNNLDGDKTVVPAPPTDDEHILMGYMCGQCFFTQICFENVSNHTIHNHPNDEAKIFHILLTDIDFKKKQLKHYEASKRKITDQNAEPTKRKINTDENGPPAEVEPPKKLRSSTRLKITFEDEPDILNEKVLASAESPKSVLAESTKCFSPVVSTRSVNPVEESDHETDYIDQPEEFTGLAFEQTIGEDKKLIYLCKIQFCDFSDTLKMSFKKHVQRKHKDNKWNGECQFCDYHSESDSYLTYANHYLEEHLEPAPKPVDDSSEIESNTSEANVVRQEVIEKKEPKKSFLQLRPLSDLLEKRSEEMAGPSDNTLPRISDVVSLNNDNLLRISPSISSLGNDEHILPDENNMFNIVPIIPQIVDRPDICFTGRSHTLDTRPMPECLISFRDKSPVVTENMVKTKMVHMYKCAGRFCSYTTNQKHNYIAHLDLHLTIKHKDHRDVLRCVYCGAITESAVSIACHIFEEHGYCQYGCDQCFFVSITAFMVRQHMIQEHAGIGTVLKMQNVKGNDEMAMRNMLPKNMAAPDFGCPVDVCDHTEPSATMLVDHLKHHHPTVHSYACKVCKNLGQQQTDYYTSPGYLIEHLKSHNYALYQCAYCVHGCMHENEIMQHIVSRHPYRKPLAYIRCINEQVGLTKRTKRLKTPLHNLDKVESSLAIENIGEESFEHAFRRAHMLETGEDYTQESKPEQGSLDQSTEDIICLDSDEESVPKTPGQKSVVPTESRRESIHQVISLSDDEESSGQPSTHTKRIPDHDLFSCGTCGFKANSESSLRQHFKVCVAPFGAMVCPHCVSLTFSNVSQIMKHLKSDHQLLKSFRCGFCNISNSKRKIVAMHITKEHKKTNLTLLPDLANSNAETKAYVYVCKNEAANRFGPHDIERLPTKPIFDQLAHCSLCEFSSKVKTNMKRHLESHKTESPTPTVAPVNPVPHLETNEMHFDRMTNLASSSHAERTVERQITLTSLSEAELNRYPCYIPKRERLACGAVGCTYISLDENMLKEHWTTLHSDVPSATAYRCVHCPPNQKLDTSKPLTATRIVAHLRMHGDTLYACSYNTCYYYHHNKKLVVKHIEERHPKELLEVNVLREPREVPAAPPQILSGVPTPSTSSAPTMDLKKWKCGFCEFSHPLRQDILEHCSIAHNVDNRFRCSLCPYTNNVFENVERHGTSEHNGKNPIVLHVYFKEGSIEEAKEDQSLWKIQQELLEKSLNDYKRHYPNLSIAPIERNEPDPDGPLEIDFSRVKQEQAVDPCSEESEKFGSPGMPNGVKYACPKCNTFTTLDKDLFIGHLNEEIVYRSWPCPICSYKTFTEKRLKDHLNTEHVGWLARGKTYSQERDHTAELWTDFVIKHQDKQIKEMCKDVQKDNRWNELEKMFGPSCKPKNRQFACPKCDLVTEKKSEFEDHLFRELQIYIWSCEICSQIFQYYEQARSHAQAHSTTTMSPVSKVPTERKHEWIKFVVSSQEEARTLPGIYANSDSNVDVGGNSDDDNNLLVVRFESESTVVPDAPAQCTYKADGTLTCPFCTYSVPVAKGETLRIHAAVHFSVKPYRCSNCAYMASNSRHVKAHIEKIHAGDSTAICRLTCSDEYLVLNIPEKGKQTLLHCLECEEVVLKEDVTSHKHGNKVIGFVQRGQIVYRCGICYALNIDEESAKHHHSATHELCNIEYTIVRMGFEKSVKCSRCDRLLPNLRDLKCHSDLIHPGLPYSWDKSSEPPKKKLKLTTPTARKSTTKLPSSSVAKKSTTKLPSGGCSEYSFYGSKPPASSMYSDVYTYLTIGDSVMPFKLNKLQELLKLSPKVVVQDYLKK